MFDTIVTGPEFIKGKLDPEIFLITAQSPKKNLFLNWHYYFLFNWYFFLFLFLFLKKKNYLEERTIKRCLGKTKN